MPYTYSDHLGVRTLNSSINDTTTTIPLDALPSKFADDVEAADNPRFPIRIGGNNRASHERVVCTGVNRGSNELVVERDVKFGKESHNSGTRVAHPYIAESAAASAAKERALPEPWEPSDFLAADDSVAPTVDQVLTHYPWEDAAGISKIPRFLLDFTRIEKIPNALQRNHVRSSVATRWDANGDLVEDASGTLRLQRDPATGDVLGLLYEPKRTQSLTSPQDITDAAWAEVGVSTTSNVGTTKNQNYDRLQEDGSSGEHQIDEIITRQSEGVPFAVSAIVKEDGAQWFGLRFDINDDDNNLTKRPRQYFDLANGATGSKGTDVGYTYIEHSIQDLGNGWYRCKVAVKPDSAYALNTVRLFLADGDGTPNYTGDGSSGIYVMHAQAEMSREVTTPILSGGAVREADGVNYSMSYPDKSTGVAFSIKQEAGGSYKDVGYTLLGTGGTSERDHGALMDGGGLNDLGSDGWKTVTRNSDDTDNAGDSPADETIDRFQVRYPTPANVQAPVRVIRQLADFTQTLTSTQKSDLDSNYLTTP